MVTAVGTFSGRNQYRLVEDVWQAGQNVSENYSDVNWALRIDESPNWGSYSYNALTWNVSVHGQGWSGSTTYDFRNYDQLGLGSGGRRVYHNDDGTMGIGFDASAGGNTTIGGASCGGSLGLDTIPRKSTINFVNPYYENLILGSNSYVTFNRASSNFVHVCDYYFGNRNGRAITNAGADANWVPGLEWADQITDSNTGVGTFRTHTYNNGTMIGYIDNLFRVYVPDDSRTKPTFTGKSVAEANSAVTAIMGAGKYVQGLSRVKGTMTGPSAKYSARIVQQQFIVAGQNVPLAGDPITGTTSAPISQSGTVGVQFAVKDSRGFEYSEWLNIDVLPYAVPTLSSVQVRRATSTGVPQEDGTFLRVDLSAGATSLINSTQRNRLTVRTYTRERGQSNWTLKATPVNGSSTLTYAPANGFFFAGPHAVDKSYEVRIEVSDQFATVASEYTVSVAGIFQHWTKDTSVSPARSVMGIAKYWEKGVLDIGGAAYQEGQPVMAAGQQALLDPNYRGPGPAKVILLPGTTLSADAYEWLTPYNPMDNRTVEMVRMGSTWAIMGHSGHSMHGGPQAIMLDTTKYRIYNEERADWVWREYVAARRLSSGIVVLSGLINSVSTTSSGDLIGTLPPGCRPDTTLTFPIEMGDNSRSIDINPDGSIRARSGYGNNTYITLEGICFPAAGVATWTPLALANSWVSGTTSVWGTPAYWKDPYGTVWFRGMLKGGGTAENTMMASLPTGMRPALYTHMRASSQDNFGFASADPAGQLQYKAGSAGNDGFSLAGLTVPTPDAYNASPWRDLRLITGGRYNVSYPAPRITRRPDGLVMMEGLIGGVAPGNQVFRIPPEMRTVKRGLLPAVGSAVRARYDFGGELMEHQDFTVSQGGNGNSWYALDGIKWAPGL